MTRQKCPYHASGRSALVLVLLSRLADDITMKGGVWSDKGGAVYFGDRAGDSGPKPLGKDVCVVAKWG